MARSKLKEKKKISKIVNEVPAEENKIPIPNLPDNVLHMKVKSGTKIRNVLEYSLKEFPRKDSVVWSGVGHGIGKVISCAEIFKRKISGLHQITKLRYVQSENFGTKSNDLENLKKGRVVPEIHIWLSKNILDTQEPGYQAPGICSMFQDSEVTESSTKSTNKEDSQIITKTRMSNVTAEAFASMGLRTGQKRTRQENQGHHSTKKLKKTGSNKN